MSTQSLKHDSPASVEDLVGRIADLVLERQSLRAGEAGSAVLEHNRLELVRAHQSLSHALIARHHAPMLREAAA